MRVCIMTLGTRGDVQPYVALAQRLIKNNHSAIICTGGSFEEFILESGVEFYEIASDLMAIAATNEGKAILEHPLKNMKLALKYTSEVINPRYRQSLDDFYQAAKDCDLIVYHPKALGAVDIALALHIPCVSMPPVPITYPIHEFANLALTTKNLGPLLNKLSYQINVWAEKSQIKEINDFRVKTLGLKKRNVGKYYFNDGNNKIPIIYPVSKHLFNDVTSWNDDVFLSGFLYVDTNESLSNELLQFIGNDKNIIVVTFSSMPLSNPDAFMDKLVIALEKTHHKAIILTGNSGITKIKNESCYFVTSASHSLLFAYAKGVIHHGGVGTMAQALKSGIPQLIIPFSVDQPFWAKRLYKLGLTGKPLSEKTLTVDSLCNAIALMDDPTINANVKHMASLIRKESSNDKVVDYLCDIVKQYQ